jgi:diguanylate cyclase (GGDEF)-like protein
MIATAHCRKPEGTDHLDDALNSECSRARRYGNIFSLVFAKVSQYRRILLQCGVQAATRLVAEVGRQMEENVRSCDRVFRYSDSEYLILLPNTPEEEGLRTAMKLKSIVESGAAMMHNGIPATEVEFSVSMFPHRGHGAARRRHAVMKQDA